MRVNREYLPFPSFSVSRPTRMDAPLFATPYMIWTVHVLLDEIQSTTMKLVYIL
jgi:hypothetical protein